MNNDTSDPTDAAIFTAVFKENWENARGIKTERISFMNAYSLITAGVLTLLQSVHHKGHQGHKGLFISFPSCPWCPLWF